MKPVHALACLLLSAPAALAADTLYSGGPIISLDSTQPAPEAVLVRDGRILFVGGRQQALQLSPQATAVDLHGNTLAPGFIDGHSHVSGTGLQALSANLLPAPDGQGNSIPELQRIMRRFLADTAAPAGYPVLIGFGYDDSQLAERRHPTRQELDAISTDLPVILMHQSGHLGAYNSKALEVAGISAATPDPEGGVIRRESGSQAPNGVMEETAHNRTLAKLMPTLGLDEAMAMLKAGQALYMKNGYTTVQDGNTDAGTLAMLPLAGKQRRLKIDVVAYPNIEVALASPAMQGPYYGQHYTDHFRIGGVKITLDGSPQGKTAWLSQPYFQVPEGQPASYAGYPIFTDAQASELIGRAWEHGWQVLAHANGDAAIDQFIHAVEAAEQAHPGKALLPVLIHGQTLRQDQVPQIARLGIFPSLFPMHSYYWGDWHRDSVLGPERAQNISPTRWVRDAGMKFTSHHDAPVVFPDALRVLDATVNRTTRSGQVLGPEQRVTPLEALKALTLWAAEQYGEQDSKGSIAAGKRADLVVLSANPLTIAHQDLHSIKVLQTIKDGSVVYDAASDTASAGASCADNAECAHRLAGTGFGHQH